MAENRGKKEHYTEKVRLLVATACLCYKGLKRVEARLKESAEKKK